jgi:hypothetical protein
VSERVRWLSLDDHREELSSRNGNGDHGNAACQDPASQDPASPAALPLSYTADELLSLLAHRGLAGWAFLVRDVAAGRVRRIHLRQLPADPEIRRALIAYLQSAGTEVTLSRIFREQQRRASGT